VVYQAGKHRFDVNLIAHFGQVRDRVDDYDFRLELVAQPVHRQDVRLKPRDRRPARVHAKKPLRNPCPRSIPIERMFRKICSRPSSKATKRHRSPRRQAASANVDAMLVFPVLASR